jgi:adenine-specific DNA methylase
LDCIGDRAVTETRVKRAIEESFPIVEINRLSIPERNAFKPIYQMHKWFARRASCVFRAILIGAMKPAGSNIMEEFYKDHTHDPDTNGIRILDPFMGGGTTIVEALRLGCQVTGIDLNPVAWFIVKTEVEPVNIEDLKNAFARLEERVTSGGKTLKDELLSHYKTECPCCGAGREEANIIYNFWVKSAICTNPKCKKLVPLFSDYIIATKSPTVRYLPDYKCPSCKKEFDLDVTRISLIAEESLMVNNPRDASGDTRSNKRWAPYDPIEKSATCPWCNKKMVVGPVEAGKKEKKKVPLTVLLCPQCNSVWQYRGTLPEEANCPVCSKSYVPEKGNISEKGSFVCPSCGTKDKVINSIRKLPSDQLLPTTPYAIEGYCPKCAKDANNEEADLLGNSKNKIKLLTHLCNIRDNNGKYFKKITPADLKRYQDAEKQWEREKQEFPFPNSKIPEGFNTNQMIKHNYKYWHQMFNARQLLALSTLLKGIMAEPNETLGEVLLCAFSDCVGRNNQFCRYFNDRNTIQEIFSRHDYQPKMTITEGNIFGDESIRGTYPQMFGRLLEGKKFNDNAFDWNRANPGRPQESYKDTKIDGKQAILRCSNASIALPSNSNESKYVITDPPYVGNVNYSELSDFFYVWLRLALKGKYPWFAPEYTPKIEEIVENSTRGKSREDFFNDLKEVFCRIHKSLEDDSLMVFTFHHSEGSAWESLLQSLCDAGFVIEAIYPIHSESESSLQIMDKQAISYDLIHVCRKKVNFGEGKQRSWAGVRQEIRQKARQEIGIIEAGRYGKEKLSPADVNIILIGKCLELYSRHYGQIVDYKGDVVPLEEALTAIRMMVEQIVSAQRPLPSELEHIDPISYVYLTCLCDRKEIQSDEVHKTTRGIMEPEVLIKAGVIRKGRAKRGRTYEVKLPDERYRELQKLFLGTRKTVEQRFLFPEMEEGKFDRIALVDALHYLLGLAEASENIVPWLNEFRPIIPQIRVSFEYMREKNPTFREPIDKVLSLIEV